MRVKLYLEFLSKGDIGISLTQLVVCWTRNPKVLGLISTATDCFIWDNILGQDAYLNYTSSYPGVMGTWLKVSSQWSPLFDSRASMLLERAESV